MLLNIFQPPPSPTPLFCTHLQAKKLDDMLGRREQKIDRVLNFAVPDNLLVRASHQGSLVVVPVDL